MIVDRPDVADVGQSVAALVIDQPGHFAIKCSDNVVPDPEVGAQRIDEYDRARIAGRPDVAVMQRDAADGDEWHDFDPPSSHCTRDLVQ
jgi:hypothetical protein